jgi:hypothetical protein
MAKRRIARVPLQAKLAQIRRLGVIAGVEGGHRAADQILAANLTGAGHEIEAPSMVARPAGSTQTSGPGVRAWKIGPGIRANLPDLAGAMHERDGHYNQTLYNGR